MGSMIGSGSLPQCRVRSEDRVSYLLKNEDRIGYWLWNQDRISR